MFRADASGFMGTGHVTRCATLAETLQARGAQTTFVCREFPGNLIAPLREKAAVRVLPAPIQSTPVTGDDYAVWLGVPESTDAHETTAALHGDRPDWLVVDHYALGTEWEQQLRPHVGRLLVIDDLANRSHECDALLDQNYSDEGEGRHRGLVPGHSRLLVGPRYALLASAYASHRGTQPARVGTIRRVLVYFGGSDPFNLSGPTLTVLSEPEFSHLAVDLVVGMNHPQREALERQATGRPGTCVHGSRPHLADLMVSADLAIGAGGMSTWERMCLGLPALVVSLAENQRPTCEALAAAGLIQYAGDAGSVGVTQIRDALGSLIEDRDHLAALSSRGQLLVDGHGASRVADFMLGRPADLTRARDASQRVPFGKKPL